MEALRGNIDIYRSWDATEKDKVISFSGNNVAPSLLVDSDQVLIRVWSTVQGVYKISWSEVFTDRCPPNWTYFNGSCYVVGHNAVSQYDAQSYCSSLGGHLVTIGTEEEQEFLHSQYNEGTYWIGLVRLNDAWHWIENSPLSYANWYPDQPNNCGCTISEKCDDVPTNCVLMNYYWSGKWKDWCCDHRQRSICERETKRIFEADD